MKSIILCADDYGFSSGISEAIVQLIDRNRLNATSCMVNTQDWNAHASALKPCINKIDIGLHFALTDVQPVTMPLYQHRDIIKKTYLRKTQQFDIEKELHQQIERFEKALGRLPNFIDGHQHIHQLPIIRDALLSVYKKIFLKKLCYIRIPISKPRTIKSSIIALTGASTLKKRCIAHGIPCNSSFSGVYDFSKAKNYPEYFQRFLKNIQSNGLIMCHPGLSENDGDVIAAARQYEFNYLMSDVFLKDCNDYSIRLS